MIKNISIFLIFCLINITLCEAGFPLSKSEIIVQGTSNEAFMMEAPGRVMANNEFEIRVSDSVLKSIDLAKEFSLIREDDRDGIRIYLIKAPNEHGDYYCTITTKDGKNITNKIEVKSYLNEFIYGSLNIGGVIIFSVVVFVATLNFLAGH